MKNNSIKIGIVEAGNFYNNLIDHQIIDLCDKMKCKKLNWFVKSFENAESLFNDSKSMYQAIIFDSHTKKNGMETDKLDRKTIEAIKLKNKDCLFITISGYREMLITAEFYKDGELFFYYLKQSNIKNQNFEESCSIPALYKLMDKLLNRVQQNEISDIPHKKNSNGLRISA